MSILKDDSAQTGTILFIIIGVFLIGITYAMLGTVMNENQVLNNDLISNSSLPYSEKRADMMGEIYDYFWAYPLYVLLIFIVYGVKRSIDKQAGVI